tara:strand:+ start:1787 stop:2011 length:225 start_codon:yes stop_codon:yes gene_type:complete
MIWLLIFAVLFYLFIKALFGFAGAILELGFFSSICLFLVGYFWWNYGYWATLLSLLGFIGAMMLFAREYEKRNN